MGKEIKKKDRVLLWAKEIKEKKKKITIDKKNTKRIGDLVFF